MIENLSGHLFWDLDRSQLDPDKNKKLIVQRVLDYGLLQDWLLMVQFYGLQQIGETAITIKDLDPKSASFVAALTQIPKNKFLCFTTQQSTPKHWNF